MNIFYTNIIYSVIHMENAFLLEQLKIKRIPNKDQKDGIRIHNIKLQETPEHVVEELIEENIEKIDDDIEQKPKIKIVDYREKQQVDREMILDRLFNRKELTANPRDLEEIRNIQTNILSSEVITFKPKKSTKLSTKIVIDKETAEQEEPVEELIEEKERLIQESEKELKELKEQTEEVEEKAQEVEEKVQEETKAVVPRKRKIKKVEEEEEPQIGNIDLTKIRIGDHIVKDRLPKDTEKIIVKAPTYYMNNRKLFVQKFNELFRPYREEIKSNEETVSCSDTSGGKDFELLTHQKIVRDYLNLYSPYRGLLLYHGLGSGKTCTSIAIAEGMKSHKRIILMTPASLKMNFFSELKKCGDHLYKKNQFWEFISTEGKPEYINILQKVLNIPVEVIRRNKGAWLVDITKAANFSDLDTVDQKTIDEQLDYMIRSKYTDINYNGINLRQLKLLTNNLEVNPFDNSVIIIDEAHNFVSRIVNKLPKKASSNATAKQKKSISYILYKYLMDAKNARIVLLTGTPIINYPNEIAILFNILRGYIKTWSFPVNVSTTKKVNRDTILDMFDQSNFKTYDYVEFSGGVLTITRNPYGFINIKKRNYQTKKGGSSGKTKKNKINSKRTTKKNLPEESIKIDEDINNDYMKSSNYTGEFGPHEGGSSEVFDKYNGVKLDETGNITDEVFAETVKRILAKNEIEVITGNISVDPYKCLPDESESFLNIFIEPGAQKMKNENVFKRRILGLTSYFRSAQETLLPKYVENENGGIFHIIKCDMSDYQFGIYERIRLEEEDRDIQLAKMKRMQVKKGVEDMYKISSTYRIFSRAVCNFAFPDPPGRPMPPPKKKKGELTETDFDAVPIEQVTNADDYVDEDDVAEMKDDEVEQVNYKKQIENTLITINTNEYLSIEGLQKYSPKFVQVLQNIQDESNVGLHLLYSQFRTIEGIGILKMILEMNGFAEFKIQKNGDSWSIIEKESDEGKPRFVLYTGTETAEEKEIIRNIYNSNWETVPVSLTSRLQDKNSNNLYGEIIKILMITASGAEGINLRNTRFVHIVEPYWHMVRVEQVIGRARRICSHQDLPEELRTIKVFLYLSVLSETQKTDEKHIELRIRDVSKLDKKTPVTTDEALFETSTIKDRINQQILTAIKETAMDCSLFSASNAKEHLVCYGYGKVDSNNFSSYPTLEQDQSEKDEINQQIKREILKPVEIQGIKYQWNDKNGNVYDNDSAIKAKKTGEDLVFIGRLVRDKDRWRLDKDAERI